MRVFLEADAPRVRCPVHGVVVAAVPWARHGAGHTRGFDEQVAWLATQCSKTAVTQLMRIAWRTVGSIVTRVWADIDGLARPVRRAAPDRDRRDLLQAWPPVPDRGRRPRHAAGWCGPRRAATEPRCAGSSTLLGPTEPRQITHVSGDGADWISRGRRRTLPARGALRRPVPRRGLGHRSPRRGPPPSLERPRQPARPRATAGAGGAVGAARHAEDTPATRCGRTPRTSPTHQRDKLAWIAKTDPRLYRAYLLKEGLRTSSPGQDQRRSGSEALDRWIGWARRCRIPAFVDLATPHRRTTAPRSSPPSSTACPTAASNRSTPRSG